MNIAIVGSRGFKNLAGIEKFMETLPRDSVIISGGAPGVDRAAEKFAKKFGLKTKIFRADWEKYGRSAGAIRNKLIVGAADYVVAFWDMVSPGTEISINLAKEMGKKLIVIGDN